MFRNALSVPASLGTVVMLHHLGWAEFVQTRIGCSVASDYFFFAASNQFPSERNQFKTRPDDASLHPVSQTFFKDSSENVGGVEKHDFRCPLGREAVADGVSFSVGCQEPGVRVWIGFNEEAWKGEFLTCCN